VTDEDVSLARRLWRAGATVAECARAIGRENSATGDAIAGRSHWHLADPVTEAEMREARKATWKRMARGRLTDDERESYDALTRSGYHSAAAALAIIGRVDLIGETSR
jgi:hypothetical protein